MLGRNVNMVLLDVDLGNERALGFVEEARKLGFEGKILVVTAGIGGQEAVRLLEAGSQWNSAQTAFRTRTLCESIRKLWAGGLVSGRAVCDFSHTLSRRYPCIGEAAN